jgi:hypothetical protein
VVCTQVEVEVKDSRSESGDKEKQNLALVVNDKESFSPIVIDETTTVSKNKEMESKQQVSRTNSSRQTNEIFLNSFYDSNEYDSDVLSISLNNKVKCQNYDMLQIMFDDENKILLIKERIIEDLNVKVIELESKIKEGERKIMELKSKK